MSDKQVRDYDKFMLRLPEGMRDSIAERAKRNGRSMNSEIVEMISSSFHVPGVKEVEIEQALATLTDKAINKMSDEDATEMKEVLLSTAKGLTLQLSKQNGYLHQVMDILILLEKKKPT